MRTGKTTIHEITYGNERIGFTVARSPRRTLGITVAPGGAVHVTAPKGARLAAVRAAVLRRAAWIVGQRERARRVPAEPPAKEYVPGETHRWLGRGHRLKVHPVAAAPEPGRECVVRERAYLHVYSRRPGSPGRTRELLEAWRRAEARRELIERFERCLMRMRRHGVEGVRPAVRAMRNRWGSCSPSGRVLLNPRLAEAPPACIDYVIIHELCHVLHPHHGPAFERLLGAVLPNWRMLKERLEGGV